MPQVVQMDSPEMRLARKVSDLEQIRAEARRSAKEYRDRVDQKQDEIAELAMSILHGQARLPLGGDQ